MIQDLNGVEIYDCPFFEIDSNGYLKFVKGRFYNRTPESFKTISEITAVINYCLWIINKKDEKDVTKYSAIIFLNRVSSRLISIEKEYSRFIKSKQKKQQENLTTSINKPGKTYL